MTTWATLFERGAAFDVDVTDVRDALAVRRENDSDADTGSSADATGQRSDTDE